MVRRLKVPRNSSPRTKGMHIAILKGQPSNPPRANQNAALAIRRSGLLSINAAIPSMVVYMANVDGRKAVAA
jgi:hypothetical protein